MKSSSNGVLTSENLSNPIGLDVNVGYERSSITDFESASIINTIGIELLKLSVHDLWVDNNTISQNIHALRVKNTTRQQMESVLDLIDYNGVTSV